MRRKDKEITEQQEIEKILNDAEVIRIAMVDEGEPYLVALNHAYVDGCIYVHSAKDGRKIDILRKNNKVAFQADTDVKIILKDEASECTTRYLSVFGTGKAVFVDNKEEKTKALDALMVKHTGKGGFEYPEKVFERTLVIKVEIESMTGKRSGF
jgi:uncharacterized protein